MSKILKYVKSKNYKLFSEHELISNQYLISLTFESENDHWIRNVALKDIFEIQFNLYWLNVRIKSYS